MLRQLESNSGDQVTALKAKIQELMKKHDEQLEQVNAQFQTEKEVMQDDFKA